MTRPSVDIGVTAHVKLDRFSMHKYFSHLSKAQLSQLLLNLYVLSCAVPFLRDAVGMLSLGEHCDLYELEPFVASDKVLLHLIEPTAMTTSAQGCQDERDK